MTKADFVAKIAAKSDISRKNAEETLGLIFDTLAEVMVSGQSVAIPGFGKFSVTTRKARTGMNPQTKEKIQIPESKVPAFSAAQALKDAVRK